MTLILRPGFECVALIAGVHVFETFRFCGCGLGFGEPGVGWMLVIRA